MNRQGARQPHRFDPARAPLLHDRQRFSYLPPDRILEILHLPLRGRLLDFGTGTGLYAIEFARRRRDLEIIALDEQPEMLARVNAQPVSERQNVWVTGPESLPKLRGQIDGVLALNVLHELGDEPLQAIFSVLAPDGAALFVDWNAEVDRPIGPPAAHAFTPREAEQRLRDAGFSIERLEDLPYHFMVLGYRPAYV